MVGEIGKLISWAQSTSPLPTLGGRTSPAGYASLLAAGRLSMGGSVSPLGDATNCSGSNHRRASLGGAAAPARGSPGKRGAGGSGLVCSPLPSPSLLLR